MICAPYKIFSVCFLNTAGNVETDDECAVPQPVVNVVQNFNIRDVLMSAGIFETRRSHHEVTEQLENNIVSLFYFEGS